VKRKQKCFENSDIFALKRSKQNWILNKKLEKLRQMKAKNIKQATSVLKKKCLLSNKEKKKLL
jgi:hypothetical protein